MHLRHQGIVLLNTRINYHKGHAPPPEPHEPDPYEYWRGRSSAWQVLRHQPRATIWARSAHTRGWKAHRVRYQLVATHKATGHVVKITLWECGARCMSEIEVDHHPYDRAALMCWGCLKDVRKQEGLL